MKVLMLAPLPPPSGGIASWTVRYKEYCKDSKITLEIVNIAMIGDRCSTETNKRNYIDELKRTNRILRDLKLKLKEFNPDIIHINTSCSKFGVIRDALCAHYSKKYAPIIIHCRCNIEDQLSGRFAYKAFSYLIKKSKKVIVLNQFSKRFVDRICSDKGIFIPNFANENMLAEKHEIREEIKILITVGHVEYTKGLKELIDAANAMPNYSFLLVGAVCEDLSKVEIPKNMMLTGKVDIDKVKEYLDEADVFLFPSKTEGFSNALLEAMARGLPIIASNVGANEDMLENKGGKIIENCDVISISNALTTMREYACRKKMSEWNISKVKNEYLVDSVMQKYYNLYKDISGDE